jgi:t-SNARE complex subunit (syntaxin)
VVKSKKKTVVYTVTRKRSVKEFEKTIAQVHELYTQFENVIADAENCLDDIERGDSRKKVARDLEEIYECLRILSDHSNETAEDFGICIDTFVDVKRS